MSYSIKPILSTHTNKQGLKQVLLQVIYHKAKVYPSTGVKINIDQWQNNQVIDHPLKKQSNALIKEKKLKIESLLLSLYDREVSAKELSALLTGKVSSSLNFASFTESYIEEMKFKLSKGRLRHYRVIINKVNQFAPGLSLTQINGTWLQKFENWLSEQRLKSSTVKSKVSMIKAIINAADDKGLLNANFKGYKNIKVIEDEPEFLSEDELQEFFKVVRAINQESVKLAGYYYLLSCFTGFRLGTAKEFNYKTFVRKDEIFIRANKNNKHVWIPIYTELAEVLEYIKDKPLLLSEQRVRIFVKQIATLAGIHKNVKFHSSRHTAATRFAMKGLSQKQVAEIIGDTEIVSKIYTHLDKAEFKEKFLKIMG